VLTITSVAAWVGTIAWARAGDMGAMPGTMGMSAVAFTAMWALMMAAMMLPSIGPFVGVYQRTVTQHRIARLTGLGFGYLGVWAAVGLAAFVLAERFEQVAGDNTTAARAVAVGTFAMVGLYQLSPLKFRCLSHCRTPVGHLIHYLGFRGPLRDVRAGASHGWFCLGCCWALMVLMVAFGVMNLPAMIGLAVVIAVEKMWRHGEWFAKAIGAGAIVYAVALVFVPELAPGLDPGAVMSMTDMGM
jgi:predicted metal-binding membrane protein